MRFCFLVFNSFHKHKQLRLFIVLTPLVSEVWKMARVTVSLPQELLKAIDNLVEKGEYSSRSDFIKDAARCHLRNHHREVLR